MELKIACQKRTEKKKNASGRLRSGGLIPANLIQDGASSLITVNEKEFQQLLNSGLRQSSLIEMSVDGGSDNKVVVKEIQRNPVTGKILHIDFFATRPSKKVKVQIGIELQGIAPGVKKGGALEHYIRTVQVKSTPESLTDTIKVDISKLDVGDSVYFKDLPLASDWDIRMQGNPVVVRVAKSRLTSATDDDKTAAAGAKEAAK